MSAAMLDATNIPTSGSIQELLDAKSLRWIFVGGKGGVGKTTTSCSLAVALSQVRENVLLISTDPAHNLSDAFGQKFNKHATLVDGFTNLFAMEIDPTVEIESLDILDTSSSSLIADLVSSIPGIDEAMSFAELMKQVTSLSYSTILFDTAPTGHTLRLLGFPSVLEKALDKFNQLRQRFSPIFSQLSNLVQTSTGLNTASEDKLYSKLDSMKATITLIGTQFKDPSLTTFVCVCIPEFLSLFETERLVQELAKQEMDTHTIVVNQVNMISNQSHCRKCKARSKMQSKYLTQIHQLYDDFNVIEIPLLDEEVRGKESISKFARYLIAPEEAKLIAMREDEEDEKQRDQSSKDGKEEKQK